MNESETKYKLLCIICGGSVAPQTDEGDISIDSDWNPMRTFSFGHQQDEVIISVMVAVCPTHRDIPLPDLRHRFYEEVFQSKEWETSPLHFEPRFEEEDSPDARLPPVAGSPS